MCIKFNFFPLVYDTIEEKRRIKFNCQLNFYNVDDLKDLESISKILIRDHHLSKFERLEKIVQVPCGQCSECLNQKAKGLVFRIMQELKFHDNSYFITLTYDDDNLPFNGSLVSDEISKFMKKLRTYLARSNKKSDIRFYGVGEYGSRSMRPHYHLIIFGLDLDDLKLYSKNESGQPLYNSDFLSSVWSKGHVVIGEVTEASAAYVARYTEKKQFLSKEQKESFLASGLIPEYSRQSLKPGIGYNYLDTAIENLSNHVYNVSWKGVSYSLPKYYTDKIKKLDFIDDHVIYDLEKYNDLLLTSKLSGMILYYGDDYLIKLNELDIEKKKLKGKRKAI